MRVLYVFCHPLADSFHAAIRQEALAGLAEGIVSAGLVAYLQVADPALLRGTSGIAADAVLPEPGSSAHSLQRLWLTVALLMLLTPLGILAAGTAWGEWSPSELVSAASQTQAARPASASPAA